MAGSNQSPSQMLDASSFPERKKKEMFYLTMHSTHFIYGYMTSGRKEMFYLMTHSTHFIYGYMTSGRKEGNVLFNDTLNTFYLQLYGVRHMVKDHSDSERGSMLPPHGLLFPISRKSYFIYASSHRQDNTYHCLCYTNHGALAEMINSSMGPP